MTSYRDQLADLIRKAGWDAREADEANGYRCGFDPDRFIADAILAAGWRPPDVHGDPHGASLIT